MASFAIEVAGEANPLSEATIVQTLRSAVSNDSTQIQSGTKQLQAWERSRGFYLNLQNAYLSQALPFEVRYLAIIQLKNGIDKYWRKTAANAVSANEKTSIRGRLLDSCIDESDDRLALQNALVIAKIARFEYPQDWPDLLVSLTAFIRRANDNAPLHTVRSLLVLLRVVKELSTARLQRSRQNLQLASPEIVAVLSPLWSDTTSFWAHQINSNTSANDQVRLAMHISLLAIKTLRRLLVMSSEHLNRDQDVVSFWATARQRWHDLIQLQGGDHVRPLIDKNVVQLAKLHHSVAKEHPAAFVLLPESTDLVKAYWMLVENFGLTFGSKRALSSTSGVPQAQPGAEKRDATPLPEALALRGLLILRACVKMVHHPAQSFKYKTDEDKEERNRAKDSISHGILTPFFVRTAMEVIVTKYFVFRESDLQDWEEEPEEWEKREEGDGEDWEFSIRSCSEKLFLDLAVNYKDILSAPLLHVFYTVATLKNEDVLLKDSLYTAIGLAAPILEKDLDFDAFVRDVLIHEIQKQRPGFNLIRRRAAIVLGQWATIKLTERKLAYHIFQHLLDKNDPLNDLVVRVTAGRQFINMVNDWDFQASDFSPYGDAILSSLMDLIRETETSETKMALLNTLSTIVERMDLHILPFAERIVGLLPPLWEAADDEYSMKQAILAILTRLVNAMKASSAPLHTLSIPIIQSAVEPGSDIGPFLLDDAMDLWGAILTQSTPPATTDILALIPYLYPIYETGSEGLRKALEITKSYILLAPAHIMSDSVRIPLLTALAEIFGTLRTEANGLVCDLLEVIIRIAESLGGEPAASQVAHDLVEAGFIGKLLDGLRGSYMAHCTTGPLADRAPVDGLMESDYFAVLARLLLGSLAGSCKALETAAPLIDGTKASLDMTMKWLLTEWFSHFENVANPGRRKLMCLALTKLLETNQDFVLVNLQSLMTIWTDVLTELREDAQDIGGDCLVYPLNPPEDSEEGLAGTESPEDVRLREFTGSDVVHTIKMPEYIRHHLTDAIAASGGRFEQEWLVNVDKDVVAAFQALAVV